MRTRFIIIIVALGAAILLFTLTSQRPQNNVPKPGTETTYTDSITGKRITDFPNDSSENVAVDHVMIIDGIDQLYSLLTNTQASNTQSIIKQYLDARSGLVTTKSSIKNNLVTRSGNDLHFTLVVQKPYSTYDVTVTVSNDDQQIPNVTFKQSN